MAFLARIGTWLFQQIVTLVVRHVIDHVTAWQERRRVREEQRIKDEQLKKEYDATIANGTKDEVRQATRDRLNS
jgi:hypothetical protein